MPKFGVADWNPEQAVIFRSLPKMIKLAAQVPGLFPKDWQGG
jgi:hypothetical protein